jgi:hypothetical protein
MRKLLILLALSISLSQPAYAHTVCTGTAYRGTVSWLQLVRPQGSDPIFHRIRSEKFANRLDAQDWAMARAETIEQDRDNFAIEQSAGRVKFCCPETQ